MYIAWVVLIIVLSLKDDELLNLSVVSIASISHFLINLKWKPSKNILISMDYIQF